MFRHSNQGSTEENGFHVLNDDGSNVVLNTQDTTQCLPINPRNNIDTTNLHNNHHPYNSQYLTGTSVATASTEDTTLFNDDISQAINEVLGVQNNNNINNIGKSKSLTIHHHRFSKSETDACDANLKKMYRHNNNNNDNNSLGLKNRSNIGTGHHMNYHHPKLTKQSTDYTMYQSGGGNQANYEYKINPNNPNNSVFNPDNNLYNNNGLTKQLTPIERHHRMAIQAYRSQKNKFSGNQDNDSMRQDNLIQVLNDQKELIENLQNRIKNLEAMSMNHRQTPQNNVQQNDYEYKVNPNNWIDGIQFANKNDKDKFMKSLLSKKYEFLQKELILVTKDRMKKKEANLKLETEIMDINEDITRLRDDLEKEKHNNYLNSIPEYCVKKTNSNSTTLSDVSDNDNNNINNNNNNNNSEYPPENIIIQNLIRTQIEFYFSNYNLKRDKRLLDQLCDDKVGFLKIDKIMNLSRIRQLSNHKSQIINALKKSKFLKLTNNNEWVGRVGFKKPIEKQFPFRRTVFIFGLPLNCNEEYIDDMLSPFGKLTKVVFDHGPDTLDRMVAKKMFETCKVFEYIENINMGQNKLKFYYSRKDHIGGAKEYECSKCNKTKNSKEGFYHTNDFSKIICLQCAASGAETNLANFENGGFSDKLIKKTLGQPPRKFENTKTALAVFTSQRQASKCVYVRSRIAYKGCFATHYHHYSKLKKEIALSKTERPPFKMIPSRQNINSKHNNKKNLNNHNILKQYSTNIMNKKIQITRFKNSNNDGIKPFVGNEIENKIANKCDLIDSDYSDNNNNNINNNSNINNSNNNNNNNNDNNGINNINKGNNNSNNLPIISKFDRASLTAPVQGSKQFFITDLPKIVNKTKIIENFNNNDDDDINNDDDDDILNSDDDEWPRNDEENRQKLENILSNPTPLNV